MRSSVHSSVWVCLVWPYRLGFIRVLERRGPRLWASLSETRMKPGGFPSAWLLLLKIRSDLPSRPGAVNATANGQTRWGRVFKNNSQSFAHPSIRPAASLSGDIAGAMRSCRATPAPKRRGSATFWPDLLISAMKRTIAIMEGALLPDRHRRAAKGVDEHAGGRLAAAQHGVLAAVAGFHFTGRVEE